MIKANTNIECSITTTYNDLYQKYQLLSDEELIESWKHHQLKIQCKSDYHWIGFLVCEDLLRQRENMYLDDHYPKD